MNININQGLYLVLLFAFLVVSGCATLPRDPVPLDQIEQAEVVGMPGIRAWGGQVSPLFQQDIIDSLKVDQQRWDELTLDEKGVPVYNTLALSGGGSHGAFGAGFLYGWTQSGERPEFKLVSGISTGALIAPYAFLGEDYDEDLKKVFTTTSTDQIAEFLGIFNIFGGEAIASTGPMIKLLQEYVTGEMIDDVARVHDELGRRLYIATTNMDAQRIVVWNMGLIAKSDHPGKYQLFRDVMMASASIPVAFPPVYIKVESAGKTYDEMHADGGTISQVIFYGATLDLKAAGRAMGFEIEKRPVGNLYIIRNGQLQPQPEHIERKLTAISARAINTMIKSAARSDLFRIYAFSQREGSKFHYVDIPDDFEFTADEPFDPEEMTRLFEIGKKMGREHNTWQTVPPGLAGGAESSR